MNPRVLVVEDDYIQLEGLVHDLQTINSQHEQLHNISSFEVTPAPTGLAAINALEDAARQSQPFDLLLLDLSLPEEAENSVEHAEMGFSILQRAVSLGAAKEIIICSVFSTTDSVLRAFREGAVDFISKPYTTVQLQQRVLAAWQRGLVRQSAQTFDRRLRTLIHYAGEGSALRLNTCFSNLVQSIAPCIEEMQTSLIDPGVKGFAQERIATGLRTIADALGLAKNDWTMLQASLRVAIDTVRSVAIEELLNSILSELKPCLIVKRVAVGLPSAGCTTAVMFGHEVHVVLTEIIAGAITDLKDHPQQQTRINVTIDVNGQQACVRFHDDMHSISSETAKQINDGYRIVQDPGYGRQWGLSVAQQLALSIGARILVEPINHGNIITCVLPVSSF